MIPDVPDMPPPSPDPEPAAADDRVVPQLTGWFALVAAGVVLLSIALVWFLNERPNESERRWGINEPDYSGPIVCGAFGALALILGAIVWSGSQRRT